MTKEECLQSENMGNYYRVFVGNRYLNYDKFLDDGGAYTVANEAYTSHNAVRLVTEETFKKTLITDYDIEII